MIALGNWQTRRAEEKLGRQALFDARQAVLLALPAQAVSAEQYEWSRISARGEFVARQTVLLDNKIAHGRPGYQVVTPLRLEGSQLTLLVNRGWVAAGGQVWQNLTLQRFRDWSGLPLQPVMMQQTNETNDGLERAWEPPNLGADKHRSYALQWYSMAALILVLYVVLNFRKQS